MTVEFSYRTSNRAWLEVTATGTVRLGVDFDTPFGPGPEVLHIEDVEITGCADEDGCEVFAFLDDDESYQVRRKAEKKLGDEYERN